MAIAETNGGQKAKKSVRNMIPMAVAIASAVFVADAVIHNAETINVQYAPLWSLWNETRQGLCSKKDLIDKKLPYQATANGFGLIGFSRFLSERYGWKIGGNLITQAGTEEIIDRSAVGIITGRQEGMFVIGVDTRTGRVYRVPGTTSRLESSAACLARFNAGPNAP